MYRPRPRTHLDTPSAIFANFLEELAEKEAPRSYEPDNGENGANRKPTLDSCLRYENILKAWRNMASSKGAGVDRKGRQETASHLLEHIKKLIPLILSERYTPSPTRKILIQKGNSSKTRPLDIPTYQDRLLQRAILVEIEPLLSGVMSPYSHAFCRGRGQFTAIRQVRLQATRGFHNVAEADIATFFERIDHVRLMAILPEITDDPRLLRLFHKVITTPSIIKKKRVPRTIGLAQGSPLSPAFANLYLKDLDLELERKGIAFVRYADDIIIQANSTAEAKADLTTLQQALYPLGLSLNETKTRVGSLDGTGYLGFAWEDHRGEVVKLRIPPKAITKLKQSIQDTLATQDPLTDRYQKINQKFKGWCKYYEHADDDDKLDELDNWLTKTYSDAWAKHTQSPQIHPTVA